MKKMKIKPDTFYYIYQTGENEIGISKDEPIKDEKDRWYCEEYELLSHPFRIESVDLSKYLQKKGSGHVNV